MLNRSNGSSSNGLNHSSNGLNSRSNGLTHHSNGLSHHRPNGIHPTIQNDINDHRPNGLNHRKGPIQKVLPTVVVKAQHYSQRPGARFLLWHKLRQRFKNRILYIFNRNDSSMISCLNLNMQGERSTSLSIYWFSVGTDPMVFMPTVLHFWTVSEATI